jgi:transposase
MTMNQIYEELVGLAELQINRVEVKPTQIGVYCESKLAEAHCPLCLKKCNFIKQTYERKVRDLSISGKEVYLYLTTASAVRPPVCL